LMKEPEPNTRVLLPVSGDIQYSDMVAAMLPLLRFRTSSLVLFHVLHLKKSECAREDRMSEFREAVMKSLTPLTDWLTGQGYRVELKTECAEDVATAIVREAKRPEYSVVFMIKRRRKKGLLGRFTRSVTESVVKRVETPVVIVRI
jgi:nucleotide-binding universal stress UspA family protein